jgi:patatin-related protein
VIEEESAMPEPRTRDEKRFAVVMYGGVSLAVYMNGVAQELYRLVQSSSEQMKELRGSANVYRAIADDLKTKFVIDILSGTSAGGINAVFLAKALANGKPFEGVESVWIETANIDGLINDRFSLLIGTTLRSLPKISSSSALLNGNKMYAELLNALTQMDAKRDDAPQAGELDLFVTATDLEGRVTPVEIMGEQVIEREYRHVFHLQKAPASNGRKPINHFTTGYNPLIAFAARCTSSFPVAFEPVQMKNVMEWKDSWREFFEPAGLSQQGGISESRESRAFADGGYLDNKPFSHAIQTISARHADHPVDRKLIYIEPSPEIIQKEPDVPKRPDVAPPNAVQNAFKAFTLARYETIRQDLQRLKDRNRLIERTTRILFGTEEDISRFGEANQPPNVFDWENQDLEEMIQRQGFGYGGYFRLRVARLTDELSEIICRQAGIDAESDGFLAVRNLVRVWRDSNYAYYSEERETRGGRRRSARRKRYARFVLDYDLGFHYRRLGFILSIIDRLLLDDTERERILAAREFKDRPGNASGFYASLEEHRKRFVQYRREILDLQTSLFRSHDEEDLQLRDAVHGLRLAPETIVRSLCTAATDEGRLRTAAEFLGEEGRMDALARVLEIVHARVCDAIAVMEHCKADLELVGHSSRAKWSGKPPKDWKGRARWILQFYFRFFGHYDVVSYPLMQQTQLGEELDEVEIIRISPEDPDRLGGSKYGNFGAFFDGTWRNHDILRGRMDGAAGIIRALYPDDGNPADLRRRKEFTVAAQQAIMQEWIERYSEKEDFLVDVVTGSTGPKRKATHGALARFGWFGRTAAVREHIRGILSGGLSAKDVLERFNAYTITPSPSPELVARAVTRLVHVFGKMLTGIAHEEGHDKLERLSKYLAQGAAIAVSLVEVFLPGSWSELLTRRFLQVIMIFGLIAIVGGSFLEGSNLGQLGAYLFGAGLLCELIRIAIAHFFRTGKLARLIYLLLVVVGIALMVNGYVYAPDAIAGLVNWIKALAIKK